MPVSRKSSAVVPRRTPDTARCSTRQHQIANRVRLTLSLCDHRADIHLSHPVVASGMSRFLGDPNAMEYTMLSRMLRARRNWTADHIVALASFANSLQAGVDPGWIAFGHETDAPVPIIPADCPLRPETSLDGLHRSMITLRQLRAKEARARGEK